MEGKALRSKKKPLIKLESKNGQLITVRNKKILYEDNQSSSLQSNNKKSRKLFKKITLGGLNAFSLGVDQRLYNYVGKVSAELLTQMQGEKKLEGQSQPARVTTCNCKRSRCLKLYCECFSIDEFCNPKCQCQHCQNQGSFQQERVKALSHLKFKKKEEDDDSAGGLKYPKGCNCKKSKCQKRYCECFQMGVKCGESCKCKECLNMDKQMEDIKQDDSLKFETPHLFDNKMNTRSSFSLLEKPQANSVSLMKMFGPEKQ